MKGEITRALLEADSGSTGENAVGINGSVEDGLVKLVSSDGGHSSKEIVFSSHGGGGGSTTSAVLNLITTAVGAGIMALPATVKVLGLPLGVASILLLGWLTDFSLRLIVRASVAGSFRSYGQLMGGLYGPTGRLLAQVSVMLQAFGSLVVYLIITGDVLSGSDSGPAGAQVHHRGVLEEWAGGPIWWNSRLVVLVLVVLFILLPLVSLSRIDSLMASSAVSMALAVVFVLFTIGACITKFARGQLASPRLFPDLSNATAIMRTFTSIPVMANAFICHYNVQPIYEELGEKTEKTMCRVTKLSQMNITAIYISAAVSCYLLFGESTAPDVLANFDEDLGVPKIASDLVRLGYVIHVLLVFPIIHFPLRLTLDVFAFPHASLPLAQDRTRFVALTLGLLGLIFFCATVIPDIYVLFSFIGALVSVSIGFTFPALIGLRLPENSLTRSELIFCWLMVVFGVYLTITGLIADTALL